jgi:hypothetical protein
MTGSTPEYGIILSKDVMVPMRDGIRLATDIYRPARDGEPVAGPFPAILCRTPYDKTDRRYSEIADFFTPRGYVTVLQDLRDRYRSEGSGHYFHTANAHEGPDGYDTVEWIAARPWSNGRIGTVGSSFAALVQAQMALQRPPHLTAIWPDVTPTNNYHHQAREGGAMQLHMFWALFIHAQDAQDIRADPQAQAQVWDGLRRMRELIYATPFKLGQLPLALVPNLEETLFDYYWRGAYDDYWQEERNDFERYFERHADIPGTFSGGWFDPYAVAMTRYYTAMARQNSAPQRLIMGPWTHVGMRGNASFAGDVDFGSASVWGARRYFEEQLRYFDRWLKDVPTGVENDPPVRIFVMGGGDGRRTAQGKLNHGGRWRWEKEWPLARTQYTSFYFHADGSLSQSPPQAEAASLSYDFDPNQPVPTIGGSLCGIMELPTESGHLDDMWSRFLSPVTRLRHIVTTGAAHQQESPEVVGARPPYPLLADRPDVLVFQTEPLTEAVEVTGSIKVKLWISSSALDTDFTAKLVDMHPPNEDYPQGYHMNLVDSIIRTRYRNGWDREALMEPEQVYPVQIDLAPTSNLFKVGHRIRVDISSSNFPRLDVNPNTGEPMGRHTHTLVAHNTVYLDRNRPSHVTLPIVP